MKSLRHVKLNKKHKQIDDPEKIRTTWENADNNANLVGTDKKEKLSEERCLEIHVLQIKELLITFLRQTPSSVHPVCKYLRDKIISSSSSSA